MQENGGVDPGEGNIIAFNGVGVGVARGAIFQPFARQNAILGNSIFANGGLGIDLNEFGGGGPDGVTPNDLLDGDLGANDFQNFPILSSGVTSGASTTITGSLNSTPNSSFRIEFFASAVADSSGYGEGERYLGYANVVTDAAGNGTITATLPISVPAGQFITATATDLVLKNTSEFSAAIASISNPVQTVSVNILPEVHQRRFQRQADCPDLRRGGFQCRPDRRGQRPIRTCRRLAKLTCRCKRRRTARPPAQVQQAGYHSRPNLRRLAHGRP